MGRFKTATNGKFKGKGEEIHENYSFRELPVEKKFKLYEQKYATQKAILFDKNKPFSKFQSVPMQEKGFVEVCNILENLKEQIHFRKLMAGGSVNESLGAMTALEKAALTVVPIYFAESPLAQVASIQSLKAQNGIITYKGYKARDTRLSYTAEDTMVAAKTGWAKYGNYASNLVQLESIGVGDGTTTHFTDSALAYLPVRKNRVSLTVEGSTTVYGKDYAGDGVISGPGVTGTINYITGATDINFITSIADTKNVYLTYEQDIEGATQVPRIALSFIDQQVEAEFIALEGSTTIGEMFRLASIYGYKFAEAELAKDLMAGLNTEVFSKHLAKLVAASPSGSATTFDRAGSTYYSPLERQKTFKLVISQANQFIAQAAQFGRVNFYIVGASCLETIEAMEGYKRLYKGDGVGPTVVGSLDGDPVIYVPLGAAAGGMNANTILMGYKDDGFRSNSVAGIWLPLATESMLPTQNILERRSVAYTAMSLDVTNANLLSTCTLSGVALGA